MGGPTTHHLHRAATLWKAVELLSPSQQSIAQVAEDSKSRRSTLTRLTAVIALRSEASSPLSNPFVQFALKAAAGQK